MTQYRVDERDLYFNMFECPGVDLLVENHPSPDAGEDTLRMIYEQSLAFCQQVLAPLHHTSDRESCQFNNGEVTLPNGIAEAWSAYKELGLIGMLAPTEFGRLHLYNVNSR